MKNQISWTLDASLETFEPGFIHTESLERQMQIGVSLKSAPLPGGEDVRVDMKLSCSILIQEKVACIAEISSSSLTKTSHFAQNEGDVGEELFQHARGVLAGLLQSAHYTPPLPNNLKDIKQ